jgi:excisionase family DNA binding protein
MTTTRTTTTLAFALQHDQPLTLRQLSQWLQTSERNIYRLMSKGLPHFRVGQSPRFNIEDVQRWLRTTLPELKARSHGLHPTAHALH